MSRYYTVIIFLSVAAMRNGWRIICRKAKCGPKMNGDMTRRRAVMSPFTALEAGILQHHFD